MADDYPHDPQPRPRSVAVVFATYELAHYGRRMVFTDPHYHCVAAGGELMGCLFDRIIYTPNWDRLNDRAWSWREMMLRYRCTARVEEVFL
jgi:hypothetical protein